MRRSTTLGVLAALFTGANILLFAQGQPKEKPADEAETPIGSKWWPSEFGPDDQRGAANRQTPKKVLEAKDLITEANLSARPRVRGGCRTWQATLLAHHRLPTGKLTGKNQLVHNDSSGAPRSPGRHAVHGSATSAFASATRTFRGWLQAVRVRDRRPEKPDRKSLAVFTRGAARHRRPRGERSLPIATDSDDLQRALDSAKAEIRPRRAIHTGHGFWMKDNKKYNEGEPGIGMPRPG